MLLHIWPYFLPGSNIEGLSVREDRVSWGQERGMEKEQILGTVTNDVQIWPQGPECEPKLLGGSYKPFISVQELLCAFDTM